MRQGDSSTQNFSGGDTTNMDEQIVAINRVLTSHAYINVQLEALCYDLQQNLTGIICCDTSGSSDLFTSTISPSSSIVLHSLPYGNNKGSEEDEIVSQTQQFQLLLMMRWIQQFLGQEACTPLAIADTRLSPPAIQWSSTNSTVPELIYLQGAPLADSFISRVLCLFTLPKQAIIQYCVESLTNTDTQAIDHRIKQDMKQLLTRLVPMANQQEIDFTLEHFFTQLMKENHILDLIKNIESILDPIRVAYEQEFADEADDAKLMPNETASKTDRLTQYFLLTVGAYFAVLPAVKSQAAFVEKYNLPWPVADSSATNSRPSGLWQRLFSNRSRKKDTRPQSYRRLSEVGSEQTRGRRSRSFFQWMKRASSVDDRESKSHENQASPVGSVSTPTK